MKLDAACLGHPVSQATLGPHGQPEKAIGHEPQIEPWLAPDNRFACRSQNKLASSQRHDENRWERKSKQSSDRAPNRLHGAEGQNILTHSRGLESKKISGGARSVFLDFTFYRTYRELGTALRNVPSIRAVHRLASMSPVWVVFLVMTKCELLQSHRVHS